MKIKQILAGLVLGASLFTIAACKDETPNQESRPSVTTSTVPSTPTSTVPSVPTSTVPSVTTSTVPSVTTSTVPSVTTSTVPSVTTSTTTIKPIQTYTVSFTGDGVDIPSQTVNEGGFVSKPENPSRDGYSFVGWTTENGNPYNFSPFSN